MTINSWAAAPPLPRLILANGPALFPLYVEHPVRSSILFPIGAILAVSSRACADAADIVGHNVAHRFSGPGCLCNFDTDPSPAFQSWKQSQRGQSRSTVKRSHIFC